MGTTATDSGGGSFTPAKEGNWKARCVRVIDLGTQPGSQQWPNPKHKVLIAWELPEQMEDYEGKETPRLVMSRYTLSLHENSALRPVLEGWRGKAFTSEELKGFDIAKVLGVPCQLQIVHSDDGKYANVKTVSALHPELRQTMPPAFHELVHYQIEDGESDVFANFSDNLKATIRGAEEWRGEPNQPWSDGDAPPPGDSDIPF